MKKAIFIITLVIILFLSACSVKEPISRVEYMLGTIIEIKIYDKDNEDILDEAFKRIDIIEKRMSVNISVSDVSNINQNAGIRPVKVNSDVYYVLEKSKQYAKISNGAFDPTIGLLVRLWGIGTKNEQIPDNLEIQKALKKIDYNKLKLQPNNYVYLSDKDMYVDLGGIAKGYAADEVSRCLKERGVEKAIINIGGNVYTLGSKNNDQKWRIGIQNPFEPRGNYIGIIDVSNQSVVTSGEYERYFEEDGIRYHHILDSTTGYPVKNEIAGVSVISDSSIDADAMSTALFVLGVEKGLSVVENINNIDALFITKDNKIFLSSGIKADFELSNDEFKIVN